MKIFSIKAFKHHNFRNLKIDENVKTWSIVVDIVNYYRSGFNFPKVRILTVTQLQKDLHMKDFSDYIYYAYYIILCKYFCTCCKSEKSFMLCKYFYSWFYHVNNAKYIFAFDKCCAPCSIKYSIWLTVPCAIQYRLYCGE